MTSKITFSKQESLPKLPVPEVKDTLELYLETLKPLLNSDQLQIVEKHASDFGRSALARQLQQLLLDKKARTDAQGTAHWLTDWWDRSYFGDRGHIAGWVNYSFFFDHLLPLAAPNSQEITARAARIVRGALGFKALIDNEELPPEKSGPDFLDMNAFRYMFSATRIPKPQCDEIKIYPRHESRHIIVTKRNFWFRVEVEDPQGIAISTSEIHRTLLEIWSFVQKKTEALAHKSAEPHVLAKSPFIQSLGFFTGDSRAVWAEVREELMKNPTTAQFISQVESAIFLLALDEAAPENASRVQWELLLGNAHNKWFDKSICFVVFDNGLAGLNGEHSKLDGMPVGSLSNFIKNL